MKEELDRIQQGLTAARAHLARIEQAMAALEQAGMYPSVPSEQWQSRNGSEPVYLYMLFRWDNMKDGYAGPGRKQKIYVGNKPERIKDSRRLARNRRRWEELDGKRKQLGQWLAGKEYDVRSLASQAAGWPRLDAKLWQQLELGHQARAAAADPQPNQSQK